MTSAEFKDISCDSSAVTSATTATTTTATTTTATTTTVTTTTATSGGSSACLTISHGYSWNSGQNGQLKIVFPQAVSTWEIILKFDKPVDSLQVYQGIVTKLDDTTFVVKNQSWNGNKPEGATITSGWQSHFPVTGSPPMMTSAEFKNINCGSTVVTTTTSVVKLDLDPPRSKSC